MTEAQTIQSDEAIPRSAYIHVPFCRHRCGYCNFTLVAGRDDLIERYLDALEQELRWLSKPREVDTLFFGGGTPTHLAVGQLQRLLDIVLQWFRLDEGHEFSVEANPADLEPDKARLLAEGGVTRLSIGAQSFNGPKLKLLQRDHGRQQIRRAVSLARRYFRSVSLDLIFGVPDETSSVWRRDLAESLELAPDHISTYGLTFERGTQFWGRLQKGLLTPPQEDIQLGMYRDAIERLTTEGFEHYEVSNFCQQGHRCRHNEAYWQGKSYYAAGPGASRYVDGKRETNHRSTTTYLNRVLNGKLPIAESERLEPEDAARERLVFGMRRLEGVERHQFEQQTGYAIEQLVGGYLGQLLELGMVEWSDDHLRLTRNGLLVSDAIWPKLLKP